jgi:hypothetical protein
MYFSADLAGVFLLAIGGSLCIEAIWYSSLFYGHVKERHDIGKTVRTTHWKKETLLAISLFLQSSALYILAKESGFNFYTTGTLLWLGWCLTSLVEFYLDSRVSLGSSLLYGGLKAITVLYIATIFSLF